MADLKNSWKNTGTGLGHAFRDLGKTIIVSGKEGVDKAEAEGKVEGHTRFVTTRFGNVLGSNGSVIPLFNAANHYGRSTSFPV